MAVKRRPPVTQGESKDAPKTTVQTTSGGFSDVQKHMMTGISNMIPFLIMGGLILAFSQLVMYVFLQIDPSMGAVDALNSGAFSGFSLLMLKAAFVTEKFGGVLFGFAIPMFAAFVANSIAGKLAFPAGFIGGMVAINPTPVLNLVGMNYETSTPVASGFLGAFAIAFLAGYSVKWLNKHIKLTGNWLAFKSTFLIPIIAAVIVMLSMYFVITPIGGLLNAGMRSILTAAGSGGKFVYAVALSLATAIDLGGPINKAAGFVALPLTLDHVLPITARNIAIVVPSIGFGLATLIDKKMVGRKVFDKQFYPQGKTAMFLAFMGISEGAIPFALERPKLAIPVYMTGACIGAVTGVSLGAVQWFPESAIWAWPLITGIVPYMIGILTGSVIVAVLTVILRNNLIKNDKLSVDA